MCSIFLRRAGSLLLSDDHPLLQADGMYVRRETETDAGTEPASAMPVETPAGDRTVVAVW